MNANLVPRLMVLGRCQRALERHPSLASIEPSELPQLTEEEVGELFELCFPNSRVPKEPGRFTLPEAATPLGDAALLTARLLKPGAREQDFPPAVWQALLRHRERVAQSGGAQCTGCSLRALQRALGAEVKKLLAEAPAPSHNQGQSADNHDQPSQTS